VTYQNLPYRPKRKTKKRLAVLPPVAHRPARFAQTVATVNGQELQPRSRSISSSACSQAGAQTHPNCVQGQAGDDPSPLAVQAAEKAGIARKPSVAEIGTGSPGILVRPVADHLEKNPVTDDAIKAEYEQIKKAQGDKKEYKLRHILVDDEQKAKDLIAQIKAKKVSFDEAAKKNSKDPGSGKNGGDLGWAPTSNYVPEFAQAAESLKKGEMTSAPVKTQFGWHIIQAEDTRTATFPPLEEVKPQLEEMMRQQELATFQEQLMKGATIKENGSKEASSK